MESSHPIVPHPEPPPDAEEARRLRVLRRWLLACAVIIVGSLIAWVIIVSLPVQPAPSSRSTATATRAESRPANREATSEPVVARWATSASPPMVVGPGIVWVNTRSHVYHYPGYRWYGRTIAGKYTHEADALMEGDRAALNERRPTDFDKPALR